MDRLKTLEIFKAVVDRGSFTKAADALDSRTPPLPEQSGILRARWVCA